MVTRRKVLAAGATALATPYFFFPTIVKGDALNEGLVQEINMVTDNLSFRPVGPATGERDLRVAGGGTVSARSVRAQADTMRRGDFTVIEQATVQTRSVNSNGVGYMFARFRPSGRNCCLPLGYLPSQNVSGAYAGAMTLIEGPNLVGLRVLTTLLIERGYSTEQIGDLCWPIRESITGVQRERALITFGTIPAVEGVPNRFHDRDVIHARRAECVIRYTHQNGQPDGGGEGALVVDGREEFRYSFTYNTAILT